jgi:hypothetical protein
MSDSFNQARGPVRAVAVAAVLFAWSAHQAAAQDRRQLGAHQHGHGTLNIVIEGTALQAELEAPGADIVGFEHPATTGSDKAKVAAARKKLADPSMLLALPARAGCRFISARVVHEGEDDSAHHEEKHARHDGEAIHSEFRVAYAFDCASVAAITQITLPYFGTFPNAEELDVTLITGKGQKTFEVNRSNARIDMRDMM